MPADNHLRETDAAADSLSRLTALLRVSRTLAMHRSIAELLRVLTAELHSVVPFDYLALILHDDDTNEMRLVILEPEGMPQPPFSRQPVEAAGPAATVWQTQQPSVIPLPPEGALSPALDFIRAIGMTITCWLPLTTARRRIGVLAFGGSAATDYSEDAVSFMQQVAAQVAIAVDNTFHFDRAQEYADLLRADRDRLRLLLDVNNLLVSELDFASLVKGVSDALKRVIEHQQLSLVLLDRDSGELRFEMLFDDTAGISYPGTALPPGRWPASVTFERGVASVFRDADLDALSAEAAASFRSRGLKTICCVPLTTRRGKIGTLNVASREADGYSQTDVDLLTQASIQIAIAVDNALAYRSLAQSHSHLTEENEYLADEIRIEAEFGDIIGTSAALKRVLKEVSTVAPTDATVLIMGETGTGKELVARAIHALSGRRSRTFVRLSGAALPPGLLESELFGYERGAFTGATATHIGRVELAHHGTLFIDEVGDIPADLQPKLLRVLQEREFERLGSTMTRRVDVRIIAATNRSLEEMVESGEFRSDLYYRINVFPIHLPPLRERREDIPALARYFAERFARRMRRSTPSIPDHAMDALCSWQWPGNIRELENVIERAVILSSGSQLRIHLKDLQPRAIRPTRASSSTLRETEREAILSALRASGGVVSGATGAAARLGLKRTTLQSMMRKFGIKRPSY
jgi:formate hydrogenlyase transcriptional activator